MKERNHRDEVKSECLKKYADEFQIARAFVQIDGWLNGDCMTGRGGGALCHPQMCELGGHFPPIPHGHDAHG